MQGGSMRLTYALLFSALLALTGCGDDQAAGNAPPPAQHSKWTPQELSDTTESCAKGGSQAYGEPIDKWRVYCGCLYGIASQRWTIAEFRNNFQTYFQQLRDDNSHSTCIGRAGVTNF